MADDMLHNNPEHIAVSLQARVRVLEESVTNTRNKLASAQVHSNPSIISLLIKEAFDICNAALAPPEGTPQEKK